MAPRHSSQVDKGDDGVVKNSTASSTKSNSTSSLSSKPTSSSSSFSNVAALQRASAMAKQKQKGSSSGTAALLQAGLEIATDHDPDLQKLEQRLTEEVDEDFFEDPRRFNTLPRVIDVLGVQMIDDATAMKEAVGKLPQNPAYKLLKAQQKVVEDAIEHLAVIHCADLNASVFRVGRAARQFNEAVEKVKSLRKSVREIQDSLGSHNSNGGQPQPRAPLNGTTQQQSQNAAAMSLRELWLKKLECEATLSMLDKLDVIRAAPAKFDALLKKARIGASVLTVSQALETMFRDDVAQVQALHKIMEQLMIRKQTAEEVVWDTLADVVFLRTGNGISHPKAPRLTDKKNASDNNNSGIINPETLAVVTASSSHSVSSDTRRTGGDGNPASSKSKRNLLAAEDALLSPFQVVNGMINPFATSTISFATEQDFDLVFDFDDDDDNTVASERSNASLFSIEGDADDQKSADAAGDASKSSSVVATVASVLNAATKVLGRGSSQAESYPRRCMIPASVIEAELDLENDERRIQEEIALSGMAVQAGRTPKSSHHHLHHTFALPRYADPVLALRILVECLAYLKRLDDVERNLQELAENEIRLLVQREQARTFARLERKAQQKAALLRNRTTTTTSAASADMSLKDFRRHLTGLLSAFGSVLLRLSHLAQILRFRISSDRELSQKIEVPTSALRTLISFCQEMMQNEIKAFLLACTKEPERTVTSSLDSAVGRHKADAGSFFSLGVLEDQKSGEAQDSNARATATRSSVMEMPTPQFVSSVLFSRTKLSPQTRHVLVFRRMVARWTSETEALKVELAKVSGESTSSAAFTLRSKDVDALTYLDRVIQKDLLPAMQEEAVNGTVLGLERRDGFDPVLERSVYRPNSSEVQDVDMCIACQSVYLSTGPLFQALHRLPRGGEMYLPVVAVLEHVMLTFISRIKQQIAKVCENKTALTLLEKENGKPSPLSIVMEKRQPFAKLVQAYADGDLLEAAKATTEPQSGAPKLAPSASDTAPIKSNEDADPEDAIPEITADGIEGEEMIFQQELKYLQPWLDFSNDAKIAIVKVCSDEDLMKAVTLAHSLLKVASLLEDRLKVRHSSSSGFLNHKPLPSTRQLREAIKTVLLSGLKMAKFCRLDMMLQTVVRLAKVSKSSTLVARDAVRIPSSVNDLGEYFTGASDNLREAAGNAVTAYTFSSLEQFIPFCLMQTVRLVAQGKGIIKKAPLTMNGIEALDRSGSVLYRDLKGATAFDNSFWDVDLAALSFERSAGFMAMMELEMEELVAYYNANQGDFSEEDFILMFSMDGPRRKGDVSRFHMMKRRGRGDF